MASWTPEHYRAIDTYAKRNRLRVTLGSFPTARFLDSDGKLVSKHINDVVKDYQAWKLEEAREKRRNKRLEERNYGGSNPGQSKGYWSGGNG